MCEFENRFGDFKNYKLKFFMFFGLFTYYVENADEELHMYVRIYLLQMDPSPVAELLRHYGINSYTVQHNIQTNVL
jgi:hypothetical protein